jgi:ribose/xylose/arabinose/galactoside ABC-type transport system permease subunit
MDRTKNQFIKATPLKGTINKLIILLVLIGLVIVFSISSPNFLTGTNIANIFKQISVNGIIAIGMTFVILTGGIDLSVGPLVAIAGVIMASIAKLDNPAWGWGLLAGVAVALLLGVVNGILIAYFKVVPFIQTLAMMSIARGLTLMYSNGKPISDLHHDFTEIGKNEFMSVPTIVWIFIIILVIAMIYLYRTRQGRHIYALGGNEQATYISGVNTRLVKSSVYAISGLLCGIAAVVLTARVASGIPRAGEGYELDAISAVVIGGASMSGGKGTLSGTLLGVLIIGVLNNGMDLLSVSSYLQSVIKGIIIIVAVLMDKQSEQ